MGAVDVGIAHDDDALVAQLGVVVAAAHTAAEGLDQVAQLLVGAQAVAGGAGDVEDLAPERQHRLGLAVARLLGRAAGGIALDQEDLRALGGALAAVGELAGQAHLAGRGLARELARLAAALALLGAVDDVAEEGVRRFGIAAQPVVEMVLDRGLDEARRLGHGQALLGLALELWRADEERQHDAGAVDHVLGGDLAGAPVADQLAIGPEAAGQRVAQAELVAAALGRRHRVAVGVHEAGLVAGPGDGPFQAAGRGRQPGLAEEGPRRHRRPVVEGGGEVVGEAPGEVQHRRLRHLVAGADQRRVAAPADLDAAEEIRLRAGETVEGPGAQPGAAEDVGIGMEADGGAAAVVDRALPLQAPQRAAAAVLLDPELAVAGDLDGEAVGERVHHRQADAVQAAGGVVDLVAELAAGMERGEDHLEGRLVLELGVRVDRDAAAVVAHRHRAVGVELELDPVGVAGDGLVHGVVEDLGDEVVQGRLVGAADVHARPAAHRLQALEHLDVLGGVVGAGARSMLEEIRGFGHYRCDPVRKRPHSVASRSIYYNIW